MQRLLLFIQMMAIVVAGNAQDPLISFPGGSIRLSPFGFPAQIVASADSLLIENIHFHVIRQSDAKDVLLKSEGVQFTKKTVNTTGWKTIANSEALRMVVEASLDQSGRLSYSVQVEVLSDLDVQDIVLHIPFRKEMAGYMGGLGKEYDVRTDSMFRWKWGASFGALQKIRIGTLQTGLQYAVAGMPDWTNHGKGGIDVGVKGRSMLANIYSGPRALKKGEYLYFVFSLQIFNTAI
jgi:Family of unknown function (DUF6067)